jgi:ABC-type branched-subunit amino acid transport system substrate-binding protein
VLVALGAAVAVVIVLTGGAGTAATTSSPGAHTQLGENGTWPGLGTVCERGPGGPATARGVGAHSIDIATFADPGNTAEPGLNKEFFQLAGAFAKWCNSAGGIDGRTIVVHDRDGALFNAAQVTDEACQQDFMSVGGGLVFDQSAVPVRVGCGLGEIPSYVVSNEADDAGLQVNPLGIRVDEIEAGWYDALGRRYPSAITHFGIGAANEPSILEPTQKWEQAAEQQGWKVVDFQEPPFTVADWSPYVAQAQSKGVQALETPTGTNVQTYFEAMQTAGYHPTFIFLGIGIPEDLGKQTYDVTVSGSLPPIYFATQNWPFELASQSPGLQQLIALMRTDAPGDTIDTNDEYAVDAWLLFAKSASACGADLTVSCVLDHAAAQRGWTGGGVYAPIAHLALSNERPTPSDCFLLMQVKGSTFSYDKADTQPNAQIWHCDPRSLFPVSGG